MPRMTTARQPDNVQNNPTDTADTGQTADVDGKELAIAAMEARIASLEAQLHAKDELLSVKDTQIDQLHHLFLQTALSAASVRPWWKIW